MARCFRIRLVLTNGWNKNERTIKIASLVFGHYWTRWFTIRSRVSRCSYKQFWKFLFVSVRVVDSLASTQQHRNSASSPNACFYFPSSGVCQHSLTFLSWVTPSQNILCFLTTRIKLQKPLQSVGPSCLGHHHTQNTKKEQTQDIELTTKQIGDTILNKWLKKHIPTRYASSECVN